MLKTITFLFCTVFVSIAVAQSPENALAAVHYNCTYLVDSTRPESPNKEEGVLYIGKKTSLYTSYSHMLTEQRLKDLLAKNPEMKFGNLTANFGYPISFYKDVAGNSLQSMALFRGNNYLLEEKIPEIDWKISEETKTIGGYDCQKATTTFRGRTYEAWFCNKLPYHIGPWKLGGLPGLILEASDTKKEFVFSFKSFEDAPVTVAPIQLPGNTIKTTLKELTRAIEGSLTGAASEGSLMVTGQTATSGAPGRKKQYNNHMEKEK
jgi:GLPGLI family protein